jgi:hypothetical protein
MNRNIKIILFNPFEKIAGFKALLIGLAVIIVSAVAGWYAGVNFDGVIDMHILKKDLKLQTHFIEVIFVWFLFSAVLFAAGTVVSKSKIRLIDVFGTQALARWPFLPAVLITVLFNAEKISQHLMYVYLGLGEPTHPSTLEYVLYGFYILLTLLFLVYTIYLMYKAYSVSCNLTGAKGIFSFIIALIIAEFLSKYLLMFLYLYSG